MASAKLKQLLLDLTQHAQALTHTESLDEYQRNAKDICRVYTISLQQLSTVRGQFPALNSISWQELADEGVALVDATKGLNALMRYGSPTQACAAAVIYSWLLRSPDAPVHNMLDTLTFSGCLQRIKESVFAKVSSSSGKAKGKAAALQQQQQATDASDADEDEASTAGPSSGRSASQAAPAADHELSMCLCYETLLNLAAMVQQVQLRNCDEILAAGLEGCTDLLSCTKNAKVPTGNKGLGLMAGNISTAAYGLLEALFNPRHGSMEDMAAVLLPRLTPLMVGAAVPAAGKRSASEIAATRTAAVAFVRGAYSRHPDIQEAVSALARHICLKAQDKADSRTAAIKACSDLVTDLPQWEQEQFVGFVFNLSRTKQLGLRSLSVGLANNLLMNLPEPFKHSTFAAAQAAAEAAAGSNAAAATTAAAAGVVAATPAPTRLAGASSSSSNCVPEGMAVAPWSVVALAALLHRCSDRSAVVRGRALSDLAEVVDCFASLLAEDTDSEQHQVAEAFVEGLEAAAALQVPRPNQLSDANQPQQQQRKKQKAAKEGDSDSEADDEYTPSRRRRTGAAAAADGAAEEGPVDEGDGGAYGGEEDAGGPPQHTRQREPTESFVAYMPSQLTADLNPVTSLVHRRCGDPKAAVRKGALQLLEALLVMRASWQGYPRQLPGSADLALLEAATADPLVSVRKAALIALSTLLELFPAEPSLCQAWVASVLPLVRDVEVAIQDSLSDWAAALLFDKAAAVGSSTSNRKGSKKAAAAAASQKEEMDWQAEAADADHSSSAAAGGAGAVAAATFMELRQLLAAVASVGRAAGACLGKLCAGMAAKKKLKAGAVARGLEAVIAGTPAGSPAALGAWILLKELASQDSSAPSWKFLQQRWAAVRATAAGAGHSAVLDTIQEGSEGLEAVQAQATGSTAAGLADEAASLLLVISQTAAGFPREQADELAAELLQHILSFHLPPTAAGAHVAALFKLTEAAAGRSGAAAGAPAVWAKQVHTAAHEHLRRYIDLCSGSTLPAQDTSLDHTTCVAMFTIGEVALLKAAKPPGGLTVLLQALTAHKFIPSAAAASQYHNSSQALQTDAAAATGTQQGVGHQGVDDPAGVPAVSHMLATQAVYAGGTQAGSQLMGGTQGVPLTQAIGGSRAVPSCVQGHAWIALGKVCMVDEGLAKKCVPLFVQELGRSPYPVVRNNIMVALSDMLIQYTALVDAHMPRLASCLRDRHELVRRQALALLANLLMKDYVKWRGPLFHRFLLALVDPSPAVRQLAGYLLKNVVGVKAPLLAYNHFVEALFVLNGCIAGLHGARLGASMGSRSSRRTGRTQGEEPCDSEQQQMHEAGNDEAAAVGAGDEGDDTDHQAWMAAPAQFTLEGKHKRASRDIIYSALLRSMTPEHKFSSAAKLCGEVLAGVADGLLPLVECEEVLRDALCLLASKDIKISASRLAAPDEDELPATQGGSAAAGGSATAAEAAARARGKLVSALMKRHLVEQVVPVLVELRRLLAEVKHPLLSELMTCFAALLKEYKGEVEDILVADKQLAKEILYDIKQAELLKTHQQLRQQPPPATGQPPPTAGQAVGRAAAAGGSPPPAGVMPGTPAAAEVLATAERQRREQLQELRVQQQQAAAAGDMPAPPTRPPGQSTPVSGSSSMRGTGGLLQTPAAGTISRSRLGASSGAAAAAAAGQHHPGTASRAAAAGVFKTPAAETPESAAAGAAAGTAGRTVLASPAPLTVTKSGRRLSRSQRAADENQEPGSAGAGIPAVSRKAAQLLQRSSPSQATNILLPSPYRSDPPRQWNIPQHVATGEKQRQKEVQEEAGASGRGGRGGKGALRGALTNGDAGGGGAAVPEAGRRGRYGSQRKQVQQHQSAASDDDDDAAIAAKVASGVGRRATRVRKDAAAVDGATGVKVEKVSETVEPGIRKAATRKRRNV